jgi:3-oxoacyl-[acyl-carrier-protein] synthase III
MNAQALELLTDRSTETGSFFDRPGVEMEEIPVGAGVPLGIERVVNSEVGIGGAYGAWGESYDNAHLPAFVEECLGHPLPDEMRMNLAELGFVGRHHAPHLSDADHVELEVEAGARLLRAAAHANGWEPSEVEAVLIGMSLPASTDFTEIISRRAGIPERALKVSIHKGCDGSVAGLNLALNADLPTNRRLSANLAHRLLGKKVLVGGIEGLSRVCRYATDVQALQLFGTAAGVIGMIPGQTMKFLAGGLDEVFDEEGLLQVRMMYPHSGKLAYGGSRVEVTENGATSVRVAGLMHEPAEGAGPVVMARMGLVKFFVRNGVPPVLKVYQSYQELMASLGMSGKQIAVAIVHHANLKINQLKAKTLWSEGLCVPMPWLLSDFGNVSAASPMIAFLRGLPSLNAGDHVLFDGFGAGTYYDVLVVELGGCANWSLPVYPAPARNGAHVG